MAFLDISAEMNPGILLYSSLNFLSLQEKLAIIAMMKITMLKQQKNPANIFFLQFSLSYFSDYLSISVSGILRILA